MASGNESIEIDVYARVSRLSDDRQRSTEGQVDDCVSRIGELGHRVGVIHVDPGRSAWDPRVKRKRWTHLMERLEAGATGGVVVFDLARFSRRPIEGERLILAAERGLVILDSEGEYDLTSADGKAQFRDQMKMAAYESDRLSTRSRRGKRIRAMKGETNNSRRTFGWQDDNATKHEAEAPLVESLVTRVLAGKSQDDLVVELNRDGIPTATGGRWNRTSLRQVLVRPRNAGIAVYRGEVLRERSADPAVPGKLLKLQGVEPIIDVDTWEQVVTLFESRRTGRPVSDTYMCTGIVLCGLCKGGLSGRPRKNMKPYPDGSVKRQYWCQPRSNGEGCGRIAVDQRELDNHVGALVVAILGDPRHAAAVEAASKAAGDKKRKIESDIESAEQLAEELAGRLGRNEITLTRYDAAVEPLDRRIASLRGQLGEVEVPTAALPEGHVDSSLSVWKRRWVDATPTERRRLIRQALRNRRLMVMPADPKAPRRFDPRRIVIDEKNGS